MHAPEVTRAIPASVIAVRRDDADSAPMIQDGPEFAEQELAPPGDVVIAPQTGSFGLSGQPAALTVGGATPAGE